MKRPLVVIHELFTHSVLDASWSPCGLRLTACSWDGTAVFIEFTQQELGQPLDPAEQVIIHMQLLFFFNILSKNGLFLCICRAVFMNDCMANH